MKGVLASPFAVGVASRVGAQVLAFTLIVVASHSLDLAGFGSYAIAWAFAVIATTLVYTGVFHFQLRSKDIKGERDTFFVLQLAIGSAGASVMCVAAFLFGDPSGSRTAFALLTLAPIPVLASLSAWFEAQLVRQGRVRTTSLAHLAAETVALAAAISLFAADHAIGGLIAARYASLLFIIALYAALVRVRPRLRFRRDVARHTLGQSWPLWGSSSLGMLSNYGVDLILGAFLTPAAVGAYRAGSRISNTAADVVIQPLNTICWAQFARMEAGSAPVLIRAAWQQNLALGFALVVPAMLSVSLLAPDIVALLFDPSWGAAAGIVAILALARACNALTFLLEPTLTCLGKVRRQFYVRAGDATLLLTLLLVLGRQSAEWAATAVLVKEITLAVVALSVMMAAARIPFEALARALVPGIGLCAICYAVIYGVEHLPMQVTPLAGLVTTLAAVLLAWGVAVAGLLRRRLLVLPTP